MTASRQKARLLEGYVCDLADRLEIKLREAADFLGHEDEETALMARDLAADLSGGERLSAVVRALQEIQILEDGE